MNQIATRNVDLHSVIGRIVSLMTRSSTYCQYPIACLALWIKPAILLRQIHIFQDEGGNDVGYLTWARLAADTEQRLLSDSNVLFHVSEWNEGDRLWIMDFLTVNDRAADIARHAALLFPHESSARSLRRREDGTVRSTSTWNLRRLRRNLLVRSC